jgi:hypothetical protein
LNDGEVCDIGIKITRNSLEVSRMALGRNAYQTLNWRVIPLKHSFVLAMFSLERRWQTFKKMKDFIHVLNSWKRSTSLLVLRRKQNLGAEQ